MPRESPTARRERILGHPTARYMLVDAGVRYWEDAMVNGVEDVDGSLIPLRKGDRWQPKIELATGRIVDWPSTARATIHYKVCDDGDYWLLDANGVKVATYRGHYVPAALALDDEGYGDYIILTVGPDGAIKGWRGIDARDWEAVGHVAA